jgi:hypothetical protein
MHKPQLVWNRVTNQSRCPICDHGHGCEVSADGTLCTCRRNDKGSFRELGNGAGWLHRTGAPSTSTSPRPSYPPSTPSTPRPPQADPATCDKVYRALLHLLPLSSEHQADLLSPKRSFSRKQIRRCLFRTLSLKGRAAVVRELLRQFSPETLLSVPGFIEKESSRNPQKKYITLAGSPGLLCPFFDEKGRITGIQIRPDQGGGKYIWLSSKGSEGPGPGGERSLPIHVAQPLTRKDSRIYITEGPIKAAIASIRLKVVVLGVAGVGSFKGVFSILRALKAEEVIVAFDADKHDKSKSQVRDAEKELARALSIAGYKVLVAEWEKKKGKGLDDLLIGGGQPTLCAWTDPNPPKHIELPASAFPDSNVPSTISLEEARQRHRQTFDDLLADPQPGQALFLTSGTGTGKTYSFFSSVKSLYRKGTWPERTGLRRVHSHYQTQTGPMRVLYVVDTKDQIDRLLYEFSWMGQARKTGWLAVQTGRDEYSCTPDFLESARQLGTARQLVATHLCSNCPLKETYCDYWPARERADRARFVMATKASLFTNPRELETFEVIVVDEDLTSCLIEPDVILSSEHLTHWRGRMDRQRAQEPQVFNEEHPHRRLIDALSAVITGKMSKECGRLLPALDRICGGREARIALVQAAAAIPSSEKNQTYEFERPRGNGVPVRMMVDLLRLLIEEEKRPDGADTRLWFTSKGVQLYLVREEALSILQGRTLINLDATPPPIWKHLFPQAEYLNLQVPQGVEIIQITDQLLTRRTLKSPKARQNINAVLEQLTASAANPVIFCHRAFNPDAHPHASPESVFHVSHPQVHWGHYGRDNRAINDAEMMAGDQLILVGHYCHPPDHQRALVQALRNEEQEVTTDAPSERYRVYHHVDEKGKMLAVRRKGDADSWVQEMIDHQVKADIVQGIGRLRASQREGEPPVQVFLLTAQPIESLPIDHLATLGKLGAHSARAKVNQDRSQEAYQRFALAAQELEAEGVTVSVRAIKKKAGGSHSTIRKFLADRSTKEEGGVTGISYKEINKGHNACNTPPVKKNNDPKEGALSLCGIDSYDLNLSPRKERGKFPKKTMLTQEEEAIEICLEPV